MEATVHLRATYRRHPALPGLLLDRGQGIKEAADPIPCPQYGRLLCHGVRCMWLVRFR